MLLYQAEWSECEDAPRFEKVLAGMASTCGCSPSYLAANLRKLPPGLLDTENEQTLRRAANKVCGCVDTRAYTNFELQQAVVSVLAGKSRAAEAKQHHERPC